MAKERGRRAANALKAAKLPARDDAWDEERRQRAHAVRQARGGRLEAGRLREQAELARIAFGIEKMSPRRPSPREIGGAQAVGASPGEGRRRARTPGSPRADMPRGIASPRPRSPAPAVAPGACGERPSERVFQRGQNLRLGSPDVAGGAAQPNKPEKVGRQERAEGVVDVKVEAEQSDAAQDLARRRRAARAVFGPGFGVHDTYDPPARPGSAKEAVSEVSTKLRNNGESRATTMIAEASVRVFLASFRSRLYSVDIVGKLLLFAVMITIPRACQFFVLFFTLPVLSRKRRGCR